MLLYISTWLSEYISFFSVFNYITLRAVLATLTSLFAGLILGEVLLCPREVAARHQLPDRHHEH